MKPKFNQRYAGIDLSQEVTRLYFDITFTEDGENKVYIGVRDPAKTGIKDQGRNFVITLQGSQSHYTPLFLRFLEGEGQI